MKLVKFTNLYTLIFGILLSACLFFFLPNTSQACDLQISPQTLGFRASGVLNPPPQPEGWFQEDNKPFLYVDFKTENGCNSGTLYLTIFGIPETGGSSDPNSLNYVIENQPINLALLDQTGGGSVAFRPDEKPCYGDNSDTSTSDCFIIAMFTDLPYQNQDAVIKGMIGNMIGGISLPEGTLFANQFGSQGYNQPTQGCVNIAGYFFQTYDPIGDNGEANPNPGCVSAVFGFGNSFNQKLINYHNSEFGGSFTFLEPGQINPNNFQPINPTSDYTRARIIYPGFIYSCEDSCAFYDPWTPVDNGAVIPFGAVFPNDTGPIIVDPLPSNYQEEYIPLAPLPFEGLNGGSTPTLGEYLASIFRMGIVVVVILAVLMIVFHGIALAVTASAGKKSDHKDGVKNAIFGLLLAMGSWLLLNTINPQLASDLGIGIPNVSLDGPDPAWQNGAASTGEVISSKATLNGQPITQGMPWPDDAQQRGQLANVGISVVSSGNSNCTPTAGTPNCTSVYFDSNASSVISNIIDLKSACGCELIVTGGSEAWLHSSHGPNKKVIDFRATPTLNQYLRNLPGGPGSGDTFPSGQTVIISGVGKFYAEPSGATGNTTAKHWHVTFY